MGERVDVNFLAEDLAEFYDNPYEYVKWAFPWNTGILKGSFGPREWQTQKLLQIGELVKQHGFDGINPVDPLLMAISSGHGIGKILNDYTELDTPTGKVQAKDLKKGDFVFGVDGKKNKIVHIHPRVNLPVYRVWFDDGSYTDVAEGHLWTTRNRQQRRGKNKDWITISTGEIIAKGVRRSNGKAKARQWEIPEYKAVEFANDSELALPPYYVGCWLGNGCKGSPRLTMSYTESIDRLRFLFAGKISVRKVKGAQCYTVRPLGVNTMFKHTCFQFGSDKKYIPSQYKYTSIENRKELLRGLLDTDGEVTKTGSVGYSTTSKELISDVIWLARSLGLKAQLQPTPKVGKIAGKEYKTCYRCTIHNNGEFVLFYTRERSDRLKKADKRYGIRWIDKIEVLPCSTGRCITVASKDGLYLTNDFIVTHNSALVAMLVKWIMDTRPFAKGVVTANTSDQLRTKTWAEVAKWHSMSVTKDLFTYHSTRGNMCLFENDHPEIWRCDALTCKEENSEAFAGQHVNMSTPFYIFDESSAIPEKIFEVAQGGLTDGEPMVFMFGNPTRNTGYFNNAFGKMKHRWVTDRIDSRNVEGTNKALFQRWIDDYGLDSDYVRVRILGLPPRSSVLQLIGNDIVEAAMSRQLPRHVYIHAPRVLGVDVAWEGGDRSCIWIRQGLAAKLLWQGREVDSHDIAGLIRNFQRKFGTKATFIDAGMGNGVIDNLRRLGDTPIPVYFASKSIRNDCLNKRAEMWCNMRDWLKEGGSLPKDNDVFDDLISPEYHMTIKSQIQLEAKKDMKSRGLASPDLADGLALTFAEPVRMDEDRRYDRESNTVETDYDVLSFSEDGVDKVETDYSYLD